MYLLPDQEIAFIIIWKRSFSYHYSLIPLDTTMTKGKQRRIPSNYLLYTRVLSAIVLQRPPISQVSPSPPRVWQPLASLPGLSQELSSEFWPQELSQPEPLQQPV